MSTYPKPAAQPDFSLPVIRHTLPPPLNPTVVDPEALSGVPEKALEDQQRDADKQTRMRVKLDAVKQRFSWDESRAWNYLTNVVKDPDFQIEEEPSEPSPASNLSDAKKMIRSHVQAALGELDTQIRDEYPQMEAAGRQALSEERDPELHRYARGIEDGSAWQPPNPAPIFRYTGTKSTVAKSLREALNLPAKIEARSHPSREGAILVHGVGHPL